jgi:nucleotide-binding universal stress UspA family protein
MVTNRVQIKRILCPTDFSDFSSRALEHAAALAAHFDARLDLLHVVPNALSPGGGAYFPARSELLRQAGLELRRCAGEAVQSQVSVETDLREGEPWREIEAQAESLPADLVVMGTHGRTGFEHFLLGSVAEKVLRRAPCPVLTVGRGVRPPRPTAPFARILCATDLSEVSTPTLALALSLAGEERGELTVLHVLEGLHLYDSAPELGGVRRRFEEDARSRLAAAVPPAIREWITVCEVVRVGGVRDEILRVAAERDADVIVMGTRGPGPIDRMFFGSTSQGIVRAARCPVLTVRSPRKAPITRAQAWQAGARVMPAPL